MVPVLNGTPKMMSHLGFRLMAGLFKVRDWLFPRKNILNEVGLTPGMLVLDFGCGPGGYTIPAAEMVGPSGKVYALDSHPLALEMTRQKAARKGLANIQTIPSDGATRLADNSLDAVLLYDVLHGLNPPDAILKEFHRILKPAGLLSVNDHHFTEAEIMRRITAGGVFLLAHKGCKTYNFQKVS